MDQIDAVDEFWLQNIVKYKDKEFKSITKGKVDLSKFVSVNKKEKNNITSKNNPNIFKDDDSNEASSDESVITFGDDLDVPAFIRNRHE